MSSAFDSYDVSTTLPEPHPAAGTEDIEEAVRVVVPGVPLVLTYGAPRSLGGCEIGDEVSVEVGHRTATGWVIDRLPRRAAELEVAAAAERAQGDIAEGAPQLALFSGGAPRPRAALKDVRESRPAFHPQQLSLFQWMAEYYGAPLADVIENALPRRANAREVRYVIPTESARQRAKDDPGFLTEIAQRAPLREKLLRTVLEHGAPVLVSELAAMGSSARSALRQLESRGEIAFVTAEELSALPRPVLRPPAPPGLTPMQDKALGEICSAIDRRQFEPFLLYGVTGSGKTEVYIRAIQHALDAGGSALLIVPEIALTPQLLDQLEGRLDIPLALLHSQVPAGTRWTSWDRLRRGALRVAVGARSSVFAPLSDLRLIIVDEEHESSYKQSDGLRYHGRDVAVMRARLSGATVVLGSATPSFESLVNAQRKRYRLVQMPDRVSSRPLPTLEIVDLNKIRRREMISENVSPPLYEGIRETLDRNGQVVVLYNRRGFSSFLQCVTCNQVLTCPHCSVAMTFHRQRNRLLCHYCGESRTPPTHCPRCRDDRLSRKEEETAEAESFGLLKARGAGTEKVVDELAALFPAARIVRMDRDTVDEKDAYRRILGSMRSGDADILVGTQMIAKGHDLPGVTLVGIVDADVGLHVPDFRSSEKIFQLITQAAGRAGRGSEPGRVLVQTREPDHPTIIATVGGRFRAFARYELDYRRSLNYPPWGRLLRVVASSPDIHDAGEAAALTRRAIADCVDAIRSSFMPHRGADDDIVPQSRISILGPAPAPIERLRGRYRWHILVKADSARVISQIAGMLGAWKQSVRGLKDFRLVVDVDPQDML